MRRAALLVLSFIWLAACSTSQTCEQYPPVCAPRGGEACDGRGVICDWGEVQERCDNGVVTWSYGGTGGHGPTCSTADLSVPGDLSGKDLASQD